MIRSYRLHPFPMPAIPQRRPMAARRLPSPRALCLGACSGVGDSTRGALTAVTPYKVEVVQGNFVSKEQVAALKPGMSRQQVREVLGTSLLTDVFHANRWDYVFTIRRQGVEPQQRHLTAVLQRRTARSASRATRCPAKRNSSPQLDTRKRRARCRTLEATEDQLKKFDPPKDDKTGEGRRHPPRLRRRCRPPTRRSKPRAERAAAGGAHRPAACVPCPCIPHFQRLKPRDRLPLTLPVPPLRRAVSRSPARQRPHGPHADRGRAQAPDCRLAGALDVAGSPAIGTDAGAFLGLRQRRVRSCPTCAPA